MFSLDHRAMDKRINKIHRIHQVKDEKVPDAVVFIIWLEDHTLGNILRMELLRNDLVLFAGYKVPHPLDHMIELRVQTLPKSSPEQALRRAVRNLRAECKSMLDQFDKEVARVRQGTASAFMPASGPMDSGNESGSGMRGTSEEIDEMGSPGADELRFQEQLEQLERMGQTSTSFSPSYVPTSPAVAAPERTDEP